MNVGEIKRKYLANKEHRRHNALQKYREKIDKANQNRGRRIIILSSDCVGGRIMKDYELPEYTPTVNNWYSGGDFLKICQNPDYYFSTDVKYGGMDEHNEPVGIIDDVVVHFGHSSGYDESLKKWQMGCKSYFRSKKKGNYQICVIMNDRNRFESNMIDEFESLPYDKKVLFVHRKDWLTPHSFYMKGEDNCEYVDIMTKFENQFSIYRRYDRFDFCNWFVDMIEDEGAQK